MKQISFLEADICSASREVPCLLWNQKLHFLIRRGIPQFLSWISWIQSTLCHPPFL